MVAIDGAFASGSIPKSKTKNLKYTESRPYPRRDITVIHLAPDHQSDEEGAGHEDGRIGLVGPMSNYAAPPQLVEDVPYNDLGDMKAFAGRWREEHRGKWFTVPKLSGFCLVAVHRCSCCVFAVNGVA
jgi:hypothetical protein